MSAFLELREFLSHLQTVEYSSEDSSLNLAVKYRSDETVYRGWPMPRGSYITATGLRDPGFGSGPVEFCEIEWISVLSNPRHPAISVSSYQTQYLQFVDAVRLLKAVRVRPESVTYINDEVP
jgi:hypothetical protein